MVRSSRILYHESQKFDFLRKKHAYYLSVFLSKNIQVGLNILSVLTTYAPICMATSVMHRRPFDGRHQVIIIY